MKLQLKRESRPVIIERKINYLVENKLPIRIRVCKALCALSVSFTTYICNKILARF